MSTKSEVNELREALLTLTPAQQIAVEALAGGATHQEAAIAAGVTRETVTRWAGHVPVVRATLNLYRLALVVEQVDSARRIRGRALAAIEAALEKGEIDPLAVLRVIPEIPVQGSTSADAILENEIRVVRSCLEPTPPPRDVYAQLDQLDNPPPSPSERAEYLTITRLVNAARLGEVDQRAS